MRTLYDENHNAVEVPDEAEITALQDKAKQVDDLEKKVQELSLDGKAVNFKKLREALKDAGKNVDDDGNITDIAPSLTLEQVREESAKAAKAEIINNHLRNKLNGIADENERKAVEEYYGKLAGGDVTDISLVEKHFNDALKVVQTGDAGTGRTTINGAPPKDANDSVTLSPEAVELGKMLEADLPPEPKQ